MPQTYFQEIGFNLPTVLASLLFCWRIEYVFCWHSCICNSLAAAEHPDEHIRHRILWLLNDEEYWIKAEFFLWANNIIFFKRLSTKSWFPHGSCGVAGVHLDWRRLSFHALQSKPPFLSTAEDKEFCRVIKEHPLYKSFQEKLKLKIWVWLSQEITYPLIV